MIKRLITFILVFASAFFLFSQENKSTENKPEKTTYFLLNYPESISNTQSQSISTNFVIPFEKEFHADYLAMNLNYDFQNLYTYAQTGFQTAENDFKFFIADTFWFMNKTTHFDESGIEVFTTRLGSRFFYNFTHYNNLVTYNNILFGIDAQFILKNNLLFETQALFDVTLGSIDLDNSNSIFVHWWDLALRFTLYYYLPVKMNLQVYVDMANFDNYSVQRFYAPIITTGIIYNSPHRFFAGAEFNLHYTDLFSFSRYMEYATFTIKGGYLF